MRSRFVIVALILCIAILSMAAATTAPTAPTSQPVKGKSPAVSIKGMQFTPASLTIKVGQSVTWTNNDDRDHTVTSADKLFDSDNLKAGGTYTFKFGKKGKYAYSCSYHPRMKGTIVVTE